MALFPGWNMASFAAWSANRSELVQHWRGWNYVAGRAICEEFAGMRPNLAYRRSANHVAGLRSKALSLPTTRERRAALCQLSGKFLSKSLRQKALANIQGHEDLEPAPHDHPLYTLLEKPNALQCAWQFQYTTLMYLELTGITYFWIIRDREGLPVELWVLPSQWVFPRSGPDPKTGKPRIIAYYEVRPAAGYVSTDYGMGWFPGGGGRMEIPAEDIIQISYPNPVNFFDGFSPVTAQATWIDASEGIDNSRVAHFQNGAFPGVAVEIDVGTKAPSEEQIKRAQADIAAKYVGVRKTGQPVILGPGMKMVPLKQTPEEMDYVNSAEQMRKHQMAGHRVGPSVIGMAEHGTFASMIADRAGFHQSVMKPKVTLIGQVCTLQLARCYDPDLVWYWFDSTPEDPDLTLRQHQVGLQYSCLAPNEYRQDVLHLPPFEHGGDDPIVPMNMSPLGIGTGIDADQLPVPAAASEKDQAHEDLLPGPDGEEPDKDDKPGTPGTALAGRFLAKPKVIADQVRKYFEAMNASQRKSL